MIECRGCGRFVMWTVTYTGKRMPLDPDPHPDGNVAVVDSPGRRIAIVLTKDELVEARELGRDLFMPHHATCEKVEMRVFGPVAHMKEAREQLGKPAALNEALVATGIDALFVLLDGGTVEIEGQPYRLVPVEGENP